MQKAVSEEMYVEGDEFVNQLSEAHFRKFLSYIYNPPKTADEKNRFKNKLKDAFRASMFAGLANISIERRAGKQRSREPAELGKRRINLYGRPHIAIIGEMVRLGMNRELSAMSPDALKLRPLRREGEFSTRLDDILVSQASRRASQFLDEISGLRATDLKEIRFKFRMYMHDANALGRKFFRKNQLVGGVLRKQALQK